MWVEIDKRLVAECVKPSPYRSTACPQWSPSGSLLSAGGIYTALFLQVFFSGRVWRRGSETSYIGQLFFTQGAVPRVS